MSSSAVRGARIGEVARSAGGVGKKNQHCSFGNLAEKPLRGCGSTPSALTSHFPYIALARDTGGDIAGSGLWFRVES